MASLENTPVLADCQKLQMSIVRGAGFGLFLREKVNAGQTITLYRRKIISEATAKKLKKQVQLNNKNTHMNLFSTPILSYLGPTTNSKIFAIFSTQLINCIRQGNRHIRANHTACCCLDSNLKTWDCWPSSTRPLAWPTLPHIPIRNLSMSGTILSSRP